MARQPKGTFGGIVGQTRPENVLALGGRNSSKYFASNNALVFIGPYLLDEAVSIQYKLTQSKVPVYGYASQYYDAVGDGKIIVQGALSINYIDSAYLFMALYTAGQKLAGNNQENSYTAALNSLSGIGGTTESINNILQRIRGSKLHDKDGKSDSSLLSSSDMIKVTQLVGSDPVARENILNALRKRFWDKAYAGSFSGDIRNDISRGYGQNKDSFGSQSISADSIMGRPDQLPPIHITVSHGSPYDKKWSTYRVIRDVHITDMQMHCLPTGQPQLESYMFFAQTIDT